MAARDAASPATPGPREIATAEADVACKAKVNLPGIWMAVEAGYQRELISRNEVSLAALKQAIDAQIRHAEAVVTRQG